MARVASFEFYEDPVAHTNSAVCTINWTAQTIAYSGVSSVAFEQCDELVAAINQLASQDESDNIIESEKVVTGGTADRVVSYNKNVTPRTISPGSAAFPVTKAVDLAAGIQLFVISQLTPPPTP